MATIQIREVPQDSYDVLVARAKANSQSLQAYMRDLVVDLAGRPSKEEALAMIEALSDDLPRVGAKTIVRHLHADRR